MAETRKKTGSKMLVLIILVFNLLPVKGSIFVSKQHNVGHCPHLFIFMYFDLSISPACCNKEV